MTTDGEAAPGRVGPVGPSSPSNTHEARWMSLAHRAVGAGVVVRLVYGVILHPPLYHITGDASGYVQRAERLAGTRTLPRGDFFMPLGTQLLISLPMRLFGTGKVGLWAASLLWCALSCAFPWLAWKWAATLLSPRAAAYTAVGCALSPLAILYGGYFGSELPAIVLLPLVLWLAARCVSTPSSKRFAMALTTGGATVVLLLVRQQFVLNVAIALAPLIGMARRQSARVASVLGGLVAGAALVLVVVVFAGAPPGRVSGGLPPLTGQNGGLNFYYGHCDARLLSTHDFFFESPVRVQTHTGRDVRLPARLASQQAWFYRQGWDCLRRDPGRAAVIGLRSMVDMTATSIPFPPWTEPGAPLVVAELANAAFCLGLLLLVVAAVARRWWRRDAAVGALLAHLACAFAVAVVYLGEPRYRVPYDLFGWALLGWWLAGRTGRDDAPARPAARPLAQ